MDRKEYKMMHEMICYHRSCRFCKIDYHRSCDMTPQKELVDYARELYKSKDESFRAALFSDKKYLNLFFRFAAGVEYL